MLIIFIFLHFLSWHVKHAFKKYLPSDIPVLAFAAGIPVQKSLPSDIPVGLWLQEG